MTPLAVRSPFRNVINPLFDISVAKSLTDMTLYSVKVLRKLATGIVNQALGKTVKVDFGGWGPGRLLKYKGAARRGGAFEAAGCNYVRASVGRCRTPRMRRYSFKLI